ncbi:MAG: hypothetical protein KAG97_05165, partial [Victivallales bacterium]|nr:hypothetical protein [Victivallales bacterium]
NAREPISSLDLSRELGIEKTRVNRILKTLSHLGIAYRTSSRKYVSGSGMHVLAAQSLAASGLFRKSARHLEELSKSGHVTALGVLWRDKVSYLFHHSPGIPFQEAIGRSILYAASKSSIGMALLACKSNEEIIEIYGCERNIDGFESVDELLNRIREVRESGFAALSEFSGHHSVAVKIGTPAFAAIALSGNIHSDKVGSYVEILQEKVTLIEEEL